MSVALELTSGITVGPDVTCPIGGRFHPAIIAQAAATLDNLYPGRFLLGVRGRVTSEEYFSPKGKYFKLRNIMLYTKPKSRIPLYFLAIGEKAVSYAGMYGDHLITIAPPPRCRNTIYPKFEEGYKASGREPICAENMVLLNIVVGEPDEVIRKLKSGPAG